MVSGIDWDVQGSTGSSGIKFGNPVGCRPHFRGTLGTEKLGPFALDSDSNVQDCRNLCDIAYGLNPEGRSRINASTKHPIAPPKWSGK